MFRRFTTLAASLALLLGAAVVQAAQTEGEVVQHDAAANTLTIKTQDGQRVTFATTPDTSIEKQGKKSQMSMLKAGTNVTVMSDRDPTDSQTRVTAQQIQVDEKAGSEPTMGGARNMGGAQGSGAADEGY